MSSWDLVEASKKETIKESIRIQVEELVEETIDEIDEDTIEEFGEELWDSYLTTTVEEAIVALGYPIDYSDGSAFSSIWDALYDYYWEVYHLEIEKYFE